MRDTPSPLPFPFRMWGVMLAAAATSTVLYFVLPDGPVTTALLFVVMFTLVFGGVGFAMHQRGIRERPPRREVTPPSAR